MSKLSFELCKELKEKGFPQGKGNYLNCCLEEGIMVNKGLAYCSCGKELYYEPTLEEVLEELGVDFKSLKQSQGETRFKWLAEGSKESWLGHTPLEAAVRLWLAVNESSQPPQNTL